MGWVGVGGIEGMKEKRRRGGQAGSGGSGGRGLKQTKSKVHAAQQSALIDPRARTTDDGEELPGARLGGLDGRVGRHARAEDGGGLWGCEGLGGEGVG